MSSTAQLTLAICLIGNGAGQLLYGPIVYGTFNHDPLDRVPRRPLPHTVRACTCYKRPDLHRRATINITFT